MEIPSLNKANGPKAPWSEGFAFEVVYYFSTYKVHFTNSFTFPDQCFASVLTELDWKVRSTWNDQFWKRGLERSERSELCGMTSK